MDRRTVPPQYRRQRQRRNNNLCGCSCDCNYARSSQGICKIVCILLLGLAWIVIAASPYWRPIFVIGGETWPFHIVMLICVVVWLATLFMYCLFMSGYHLNLGHYNWPKFELYFNIVATLLVLLASCLEAANVWRWDMSNGNVVNPGASGFSNYRQYGYRPGMSFTQTLNFGSYCGNRPQECRDYFSLLAGHNTYHANHIFGTVFLFFSVIAYLVSVYFAYRTYQVFIRDMYKPGELPKPTMWMRFTYQMEQATNYVKGKADIIRGKNDDDDNEADVEIEIEKKPDVDLGGFEEARSSRSEGRTSHARSHSSHHTSSHHASRSHHSRSDHRSGSGSSHHKDTAGRSSRSSSKHRRSEGRSSHGSSEHRSRSSSKPKNPESTKPKELDDEKPNDPVYDEPYADESKPLSQPSPAGVFPHLNSKKGSKKGKKDAPIDMSPVASVMI